MIVVIEDLSHDFKGIARIGDKVIFVPGVLPGEEVEVGATAHPSQYRALRVLTASDYRQTAVCDYFEHCGACDIQYCNSDQQLHFKEQIVRRQLVRLAGIRSEQFAAPISGPPLAYRRRVRLACRWNPQGKMLELGFRRRSSKGLVAIQHCPVMHPLLADLLPGLARIIGSVKGLRLGHVELYVAQSRTIVMPEAEGSLQSSLPAADYAVIYLHKLDVARLGREAADSLLAELLALAQSHQARLYVQHASAAVRKPARRIRGRRHKGRAALQRQDAGYGQRPSEDAGAQQHPEYVYPGRHTQDAQACDEPVYRLQLSMLRDAVLIPFMPGDFVQANGPVNQALVERAIDWLEPVRGEQLVDAFCGLGNYALPLAALSQQQDLQLSISALEISELMTSRAARACEDAGYSGLRFHCIDLGSEASLQNTRSWRCDKLILDPPRDGALALCRQISCFSPQRIVYVSCDSGTFARDAGILSANGYRLYKLALADMFPQTWHCELIALFVSA